MISGGKYIYLTTIPRPTGMTIYVLSYIYWAELVVYEALEFWEHGVPLFFDFGIHFVYAVERPLSS